MGKVELSKIFKEYEQRNGRGIRGIPRNQNQVINDSNAHLKESTDRKFNQSKL